ncbi:MAG: EAL domain-containing protein [Alphaproteobacteria bacterium]|nr:EAL domain-containing protein [Alphaproteobacteria bacterium]MBV9552979.1 EAL domain-containing protein [Alphaproteobacteria bacterium]
MVTSPKPQPEAPVPEWISRFVADIPSAVALFDPEFRYLAANQRWLNSFGIVGEQLIGQPHDQIDPPSAPILMELHRRALSGETIEASLPGDGEAGEGGTHRIISTRPHRDNQGTIRGVIATLRDAMAIATDKTLQYATDALTGLAGRHAFMARVRSAIAPESGARRAAAIFLLDIDNFKGVNDLYGASIGDAVLRVIANRLLAGTRSRTMPAPRGGEFGAPQRMDIVSRLGADEFAIILGSAAPSPADAEVFARRLLQLAVSPVLVGEQRIRLSANIGYIITTEQHRSEDDAMRDVDVALQEAKERGPNNVKAWEPALTSTVGRRLALLDQLRCALDENQFVLHYQPIQRLHDDRVVGAEALLRWNHPSDGLVAPAAFLPVLEESGLIVPVGCWVLRETVRQMQVWQMLYGRDLLDWVSVNVSARQFNDPSILLETLAEIRDSGFPLSRIKIEITESAVMRNPEVTRSVLSELQELGIRIAIDDFGTGYSALGAVRDYQVDMIKIDRGFTARVDTEDGRELVLAMLKIARIYGADVVAEGVETVVERDFLRRSGCGYGQGYLFAKPMDGSFFGAFALTHLVETGDAAD